MATTGPQALTRDAEYHRRQAKAAQARGDAPEAALWAALADQIDEYLSPRSPEDAAFLDLDLDPGG